MKNSSNSTAKMFSTTLMITSLARPTNRPYPSASSIKRSLQLYQMLRVYMACITIQIMFSVSGAVTITTISTWNKLFTITLKLIRQRYFRTQLSCWQPDYRKLTRRLVASFRKLWYEKKNTHTETYVTQVQGF